MNDHECVAFLRWALPRLRFRWRGFRRVRRQVCKRVGSRVRQLGLADASAYRALLERDPAEWEVLDGCCRISISRFLRDRRIFERLGTEVLPNLARRAVRRGRTELGAWSAGCSSGEEPYSVRLIWERLVRPDAPSLRFVVTATDSDDHLLERARRGVYPPSSLREMAVDWREAFFDRVENDYRLRPELGRDVRFLRQDLRRCMPDGPFDVVLCRNLAFTYFDDALQREVLHGLLERLAPGGALVIGPHEALPDVSGPELARWPEAPCVYRVALDRTPS